MARRIHHTHRASHPQIREALAIPASKASEFAGIVERQIHGLGSVVVKRQSAETSSSSSSDCSSSDSSGSCEKPSSSNNVTLPVALGVIIPIFIAVVIFVYLHRRHVKRLRAEDANDPHKSLDFGWDPVTKTNVNARGKSRKNKKGPEMSVVEVGPEKIGGHGRGLSMDMDLGSPYVLPPGLHGSRESLHSLSRTMHSQDDRYRPATTYVPNDASSLHSSNTRRGRDDSSIYTGTSSLRRGPKDDMNANLLGNAQKMSRSQPPLDRIPDVPQVQVPEAAQEPPRKPLPSTPATPSNGGLSPNAPMLDIRDSYVAGDEGGLRGSNMYLGQYISSGSSAVNGDSMSQKSAEYDDANTKELPNAPLTTTQTIKRKSPPAIIDTEAAQSQVTRPPRQQSLHISQQPPIQQDYHEDANDYGDAFNVVPPSPRRSQEAYFEDTHHSSQDYEPPHDEQNLGLGENGGFDVRRLSMGMRPLPDVDPTDNPETRANRIRSFYKEYFDDSKPAAAPAGGYYEDYDENYLGEGATYFDPISGQFITAGPQYPQPQYAEPYARRAMTPPPRVGGGGRRHAATMSGSSRLMPPGPRAYSSASGRFGPSGRGIPKKPAPPPAPLRVIPSPHLLKEDAFALPIDFAPPTSAKERQAGRPESPRGGMRPYSPAVPAFAPLQSSFDDLAVMPSPHLLRKSGTFTGLDFAPPPRFKTGSDAGSDDGRSIRSNRSAMSARQQHAIRAGAYRVSRIPKDVVFTKKDLKSTLMPQWNMHNNDSKIGMGSIGSGMVL